MVVEAQPHDESQALVFVVDDDVAVGRMLRRALCSMVSGVRVRAFVDPMHAFQATIDQRPRVLLTDQDMPRCTGVELARALREQLGPQCPRIALVSGARVSRADLCVVDAHFRKPFRIADLGAAIQRWLRPSHSGVRLKAVRDLVDDPSVHTAPTQPPPPPGATGD